MKATVIGKERVDGSFTAKDTGELVFYDNTMLYCIYNNDNVEGTACKALKCKTDMVKTAGVDVGDIIVADVDRKYDKVFALDVVKKGGSD